jgi:hypothetical protein
MPAMGLIRKRGFELERGVSLLLSRTSNGGWSAWIEYLHEPLRDSDGNPRLFEGSSAYQAQCAAIQWLRAQGLAEEPSVLILSH